ncbi:MAG: sulfotransferase family protein, partial [Armatimonadaceae bacterium]
MPLIVVLGITERSGTNYLRDLLVRHPDARGTDVIFEDFLVAHSAILRRFSESVRIRWTLNPRIDEQVGGATQRLMGALGNGLKQLVVSTAESSGPDDHRCVLIKTPSVENIRYARELFPDSPILIVVRDPAAVVDSGMKTFRWSFEKAIHLWSKGAGQILDFVDANPGVESRIRVVRFEELVGPSLEPTLRSLLELCSLDPSRYDFVAASTLPVKGSSALGAKANDLAGWQRVEKPKDFDPLARGKNWGPFRRARLRHVARRGMDAWGYRVEDPGPAGALSAVLNPVLDAGWALRELVRRIYRAL